ncbi:hypothetical protein EYF80_057751 [Liparis tanakae]|uniref:Uncharacterized protein n=1 Tax=Liparis tanakae TaxID=230148 RepID=A0A4Z2ETH0_9TELE|nr:hypothetical protein EYF80_057751 [Liparis tanakae]
MEALRASRKSASAWRGEPPSSSMVAASASAMARSDTARPRSSARLSSRMVDLRGDAGYWAPVTGVPLRLTHAVPEVSCGGDLPHQDGEAGQHGAVEAAARRRLQLQPAVQVHTQQVELRGLQDTSKGLAGDRTRDPLTRRLQHMTCEVTGSRRLKPPRSLRDA